MEETIISMFAHGMSNRDIEDQMRTMYEVDVSPEMVSRITDKVSPQGQGVAMPGPGPVVPLHLP
jgi:transposase-like protein